MLPQVGSGGSFVVALGFKALAKLIVGELSGLREAVGCLANFEINLASLDASRIRRLHNTQWIGLDW